MGILLMLTDGKEIAIIAKARQKNVRDPNRSREHFKNILHDFFSHVSLGGRYLDMGPGQYDFGELVRCQGGTCVCIDNDPAVVELGRYKDYDVVEGNIKHFSRINLDRTFDGVWNKFSLNAFWFGDDKYAHQSLVTSIFNCLKEGAWGWIAPWNGIPQTGDWSESLLRATLDDQQRFFEEVGFRTHVLSKDQAKRYGINGNVANNVVYTKNLSWTA